MNNRRYIIALFLACIPAKSPDKYFDIKMASYYAWKAAGVETTTSYTLTYLDEQYLYAECGSRNVDGCYRDMNVYIRSGMSSDRQLMVLMHEVGHITRGNGDHIHCVDKPGNYIMCEAAALPWTRPTDKDVKFVTGKII